MPQLAPWSSPGSLPEESYGLRSAVVYYFKKLESYLREIHRENSFGPVPGAYFPIALGRSESPLPTGGAIDSFPLGPVEVRPIALGAFCFGGDCTIDMNSEGSSILTAGSLSLSAGVNTFLNDRADFAVEKVKVDVTLDNDSNDAGTPAHVRTVLWCKNVSKVEPA